MRLMIYMEPANKMDYEKINVAANILEHSASIKDKADDEAARKALEDFFEVLFSVPPSSKMDLGSRKVYGEFIRWYVVINRLLIRGLYAKAVNEIVSMMISEPVLQTRYYSSLKTIYKKYWL